MNPVFEMQQNAIRQSQRLVEKNSSAYFRATASLTQLGLETCLAAQQLGTELTDYWLQTSVRTLDLLYGSPDSKRSRHRALDAYGDSLRCRMELVDGWFALFDRLERETVRVVLDAARPWLTGPPEPAVGGETAVTVTDRGAKAEPDGPTPSEETAPGGTGAESPDLQYISGIGTAHEDRLEAAGITSVEALASADPEKLASRASLTEQRVREWIRRAEQHVL